MKWHSCLGPVSYTHLILGGLEYDLGRVVTLSIGANSNTFGCGNDAKFISDLSYSTSAISVGLGARIRASEKISIDLGIYKTFFLHFTKEEADYCLLYTSRCV